MLKLTRIAAMMSLLMLLAGCMVRPSYIVPRTDFGLYGRIAVLPLEDRYFYTGKGTQVADSLYRMLVGSPFELVEWSHTLEVVGREGWIPHQQSDAKAVVSLGEQLQARAILTGSIDEWRNKPISSKASTSRVQSSAHHSVSIVGFTLCLIDCRCGHVVWSDSRRGSVMGSGRQDLAAGKALDRLVTSLLDNF